MLCFSRVSIGTRTEIALIRGNAFKVSRKRREKSKIVTVNEHNMDEPMTITAGKEKERKEKERKETAVAAEFCRRLLNPERYKTSQLPASYNVQTS